MAKLRFTIRASLLAVLLIGLALGIVAVTLENIRLRRDLAASQAVGSASLPLIRTSVVLDVGLEDVLTTGAQLSLSRTGEGAGDMPNGTSAFASSPEQQEAKR